MYIVARVKETSTTGGAGNLTTASVTGYRTANTALGANVRFPYYAEHTDGTWEEGIGYKSDATTFVREKIFNNSSGTAVAVTFAAGTVTIFCDFPEHRQIPAPPGVYGTDKDICPFNITNSRVSSFTVTADRLYYFPFQLAYGVTVASLCATVNTAVASSKARFGIYRMDNDMVPTSLLLETADIDTTTAVLKVGAVTSTYLPPGWYFGACVTNAAVGWLAYGRSDFVGGPLGYAGRVVSLYEALAAGWTALPATANATGLGTVDNGTVPGVFMRGTV